MIRRYPRTAQLLLPGDSMVDRANFLRGCCGVGDGVFVAHGETMCDSKQPILDSIPVSANNHQKVQRLDLTWTCAPSDQDDPSEPEYTLIMTHHVRGAPAPEDQPRVNRERACGTPRWTEFDLAIVNPGNPGCQMQPLTNISKLILQNPVDA